MRVAVLTPLDERSAIAAYLLPVLDEVARQWDLEVWYPACDRPRWTHHPTRPFWDGAAAARELAGHDLVVHVVGNSALHLEVVRAARRRPGLVVLHDGALVHLVAALDQQAGTTFLADAVSGGGDAARESHRRYLAGDGRELQRLAGMLPLTDVVLQDSLGVLTHSHWMARRLLGQTLGQVSVARLPSLVPPDPAPAPAGGAKAGGDDADVVLVVAGVVNANKCVDRLIRAVAGSDVLRRRMTVRVVGPVDRSVGTGLVELAGREGVGERVELLGGLARAGYEAVLAGADVFACLRDPVLEAASASLLETMSTGRPVVVYGHGHYAELPADVVVAVDPAAGTAALTEALERLVTDPEAARATGLRGAAHVTACHDTGQYAEALVAAGHAALAAEPLVAAVARRRRDLVAAGLAGDAAARQQAAQALHRLLVAGGRS